MEGEVKIMRSPLIMVCAVILVTACGRVPGAPLESGDFKLYEATSDRSQIAVIDLKSHAIERRMQLGTPSSNWKHLYSVASNMLYDVDPETGSSVKTLQLPGYYQLPRVTLSGMPGGLSQDSRWLVLESFDESPTTMPTASHFLVVSTQLDSAPVRIDLRGYFAFDTVSNDGLRLYLIEYMSASNYRVRIYNVPAEQLDPQVVVDKSDPRESMTGERLSGIPAKDGTWLFSMYVRQSDSPFIHALNLDGTPIALCIDLPGLGYEKDMNAFRWSLAMSADGAHLYAANAASGVVSEINTGANGLELARSVHIDSGRAVAGTFAKDVQAKEFSSNAAVVSLDGQTLATASSSGIVLIETKGLRVRAHALAGWNVWSLALSPDGKVVYALSDSGKIAEVSMESGHVGATFDTGAGFPMGIMRVVAA